MGYDSGGNEAERAAGFMIAPQIAYLVDLQSKNTFAKGPGIYVLIDGFQFYCGCGSNLMKRIPASRREQGFGKKVLCFPVQSTRNCEFEPILKGLEAKTISALFTLINGHGLPYELANDHHAHFLPKDAWSTYPSQMLKVAICIAQTVLYANCVPQAVMGLPHPDFLGTALYSEMRRHNSANWKQIVSSEIRNRNKPGHPSSPIPLVHIN